MSGSGPQSTFQLFASYVDEQQAKWSFYVGLVRTARTVVLSALDEIGALVDSE